MSRQLALALSLLVLLAWPASAGDPAHEDLPALTELEEQAIKPALGRIGAIRAPLLARPAFTAPHGTFPAELELATGTVISAAWLQRASVQCPIGATATGSGRSEAWPELPTLQVRRVSFQIGSCPPGLYDLHLEHASGANIVSERQMRAVRVMDPARYSALASGLAQPRIVVIADPQVGDPRAALQAAEEGRLEDVPAIMDGIVGDGSPATTGRWHALRVALAQARALDPDFVLIAGDLAYGQLVPGSYAVEYEEIWRALSQADVPLFVAPGNHDGYISNGQDGFSYWRQYIGPTYTLAPTVPGTHILVLNTYDWSDIDRVAVSYGASAWGGQVREEQLAWASNALGKLRTYSPTTRIVTLAHHSPSWRQDPWEPALEGTPVAEQVERGALTYASTDQGWIGRGRLEVRDLLRARGVEVVFSGHTHHDRIARDDGFGGIVGTYQTTHAVEADFDFRALHRWDRNDSATAGETQEQLAERIRTRTGPLYVDTTTVMSDGDQYWGYRPVEFAYDANGRLDLARFGYSMTQAELDEIALHPELFNVEHAPLGLFSTPLQLEMSLPWSLVPN